MAEQTRATGFCDLCGIPATSEFHGSGGSFNRCDNCCDYASEYYELLLMAERVEREYAAASPEEGA